MGQTIDQATSMFGVTTLNETQLEQNKIEAVLEERSFIKQVEFYTYLN